jgi:4-aminobutyrate aminotransferase-like enzyme
VRRGLERLVAKYPIVANARGRALFFGLELSHPDGTPAASETNVVVNRMRENGVLISRIGRHRNILKMRPPLVFSRENADHLLSNLDSVIGAL